MNTQILIVGAGPSGLALANELALHNISFRIIDQMPEPAMLSKAIAVQARTLELLERYEGVSAQLVKAGIPLSHGKMRSGSNLIAHLDLTQIPSRYPFVLSIPQYETERILREHVTSQGHQIEYGSKLISFSKQADGFQVQLQRQDQSLETLFVPWLAACDGAHSFFRETLNLPFEGSTFTQQRFMLADVFLNKKLDAHELRLFFNQGNIFAIFPLPDQHFRLIIEEPAENISGAFDVNHLESLMQKMIDKDLKIDKVFWFSEFRINQRKISNYRQGNIFFVGDAAHIHSPVGGQGMNTGIQDAINLGWKLAAVIQAKAQPKLLDTYNEEREALAKILLRATDLASRAVFAKNIFLVKMRNFFLRQLLRFPFVQHKVLLGISELAINYRHRALSEEHLVRGEGVAAGDRWPYASFSSAAQSQWNMVLVEVNEAQEALLKEALSGYPFLRWQKMTPADMAERTHSPAVYLIRPDQYVAYRAKATDVKALKSYFEKWLQGQ